MSYDTTVHDAIDPPQPRVAARQGNAPTVTSNGLVRSSWRSLMVVGLLVAALFLVTWIVAMFSLPPANDPGEIPNVPTAVTSSIPTVSLPSGE